MNPQDVFCPNIACHARGHTGKGNIVIHSQREQRYRCTECGQTFTTSKGTLFYRLRTPPATVMLVLTLLAYGCPLQAVVRAFEVDERTVRAWWQRAGRQCQAVHDHLVTRQPLDLQHVQADELKVKTPGGAYWMAMALMVSTRLWLGGVVSAQRDLALIQTLVDKLKTLARCRPLLLAVDGLVHYVTAFRLAFRSPLPRRAGEHGQPRLIAWPTIAIVQVVKHRTAEQLTITRRIVQGTPEMVQHLIHTTQGQGTINTAFIERLNATFRQRLNPLARRTRTLAHQPATLHAGMSIVGCLYNFCDLHHSLRLKLWVSARHYHWVPRTPALAAGLTNHVWTPTEVFTFRVPLPHWAPPKQRGRPSHERLQFIEKWCT